MLQDYLRKIAGTTSQGDAREESYYSHFSALEFASSSIPTAAKIPLQEKFDRLFPAVEKKIID